MQQRVKCLTDSSRLTIIGWLTLTSLVTVVNLMLSFRVGSINPLLHIGHYCVCMTKILILK